MKGLLEVKIKNLKILFQFYFSLIFFIHVAFLVLTKGFACFRLDVIHS